LYINIKQRVVRREKYDRERKRKSWPVALLAGAHTDIWLEREYLGTPLLLCPGKKFTLLQELLKMKLSSGKVQAWE
jgi:hypothetical protein